MKIATDRQSARHDCRGRQEIKARLAALLISLLALVGCVSAPKYPENWAPGFPEPHLFDRTPKKCRSIAGSYSDAGESSDRDSHATISLWHTLFAEKSDPNNITIRDSEGGTLEIIAWKDGIPIGQKMLAPNGGYNCLNGVIAVAVPMKNRWKWPGEARAHDHWLYRGEDNWLVLKQKELDIVLPWFESKTRWYRFSPAPPTTDTK